jgi:hypothetical protein
MAHRSSKVEIQEINKDYELQAILIADSYTNNFYPMTIDKPKALLKLGNVTLLEHAL